MMKQFLFIAIFGLIVVWPRPALGHGRLWEPPSRSTMWRRGYSTPVNYQDNELFCGGFSHQVSLGYKCGICGDPYDGVRENEAGGKYATGVITQTYTQGQKTTFIVDLTANHKGFFEFRICPTNDPAVKATQDCLDSYPVQMADGSGTQYKIYPNIVEMVKVDVILPQNLTCDFCVLQWRYHGGNSWGQDPDGRGCVGCGPQEEFYGCADIRIRPGGVPNTVGVAQTDSPSIKTTRIPFTTKRTSKTTTTSTTTTTTTPRKTDAPNTVVGKTGCRGVQGFANDAWCEANCARNFCPKTHCQCNASDSKVNSSDETIKRGCRSVGPFASVPGSVTWCKNNCRAGYCPKSHCSC